MKVIISEFRSSKILVPTKEDYIALGIQVPDENEIVKPSLGEIKEYAGVDLSFGLPIVKRGFFSNKPSQIYAPSDEDCQRLGIENKFVVFNNGEVSRKSYDLKDNVAYVDDSFGSLVESIARSSNVALDVLKKGAVNWRFVMPGIPITGLGLRSPEVKKVLQKGGTRLRDTLFPEYNAINKTIPMSNTTGVTSNGLEYVLY